MHAGPVVIAGHVSWNRALAVFHRLGTMRRDAQVTITRRGWKDCRIQRQPSRPILQSRFPSRAVDDPIDYAGLRLITCAVAYDAAGHTYLDNVVVFARLEGGLVADSQARSVDHHHKRFGRQAGARV